MRRELRDADTRIEQLEARAKQVEQTDPDAFARLNAQLRALRAEQAELAAQTDNTEEWLTAAIELLRFARECDRIDAKVSSIDTAMLPRGNLDQLLRSATAVELEKLAKQLETSYAHLNTFDARTQRLAETAQQLAADPRLARRDSVAQHQRDELLAKLPNTLELLAAAKAKNRAAKKRVADATACRAIRDDGEQLLESVLAKFAQLEPDPLDTATSGTTQSGGAPSHIDEAALLARTRKLEAAQAEMRVARGKLDQIDADAQARIAGAPHDDALASSLNEAVDSVKARFAELESRASRADEQLAARRRNLETQKALAGLQNKVDRLMRQCSSDRSAGDLTANVDCPQLRRALNDHTQLERDADALAQELAERAPLFAAADQASQNAPTRSVTASTSRSFRSCASAAPYSKLHSPPRSGAPPPNSS